MEQKDFFSTSSDVGAGQRPPRLIPKWVFPVISVVLILAMLVSGIFIGLSINNVSIEAKNMSKDMPLLEEIYSYLDKYYYKDINWDELQEKVGASLANIDKFSSLSLTSATPTPKMGLVFNYNIYNETYLSTVHPNSPAALSRGKEVNYSVDESTKVVTVTAKSNGLTGMELERGDKLMAIKSSASNNQYIYTETIGRAGVDMLASASDTVTLVMQKTTGTHMEITVVRDYYNAPVGDYKNLGDGVGLIMLYEFNFEYIDEIFNLFGKFINDSNATKLIFSMNNNGGGDLRVLQEIATFLIPHSSKEDTQLIAIDDKNGNKKFYSATESTRNGVTNNYLGNTKGANFKLTLLINGNSASASEALTGAVMAYNPDANIVGSPTYGKGVSQSVFLINNNKYYLSIVVGYFYIPSYDASNNIIWSSHHEQPIIPKVNLAGQPGYGGLKPNLAQELDIMKAMELMRSSN